MPHFSLKWIKPLVCCVHFTLALYRTLDCIESKLRTPCSASYLYCLVLTVSGEKSTS